MNIVFMGTPEFSVPCLRAMINGGHNVPGVFTQPDKKVGRKQIITPSPVKTAALENGIPVYQPQTLKSGEAAELIRKLNPDLIVVVAYGKILPKEILDFPRCGCINVHASLLPYYRGAAPIQRSILNGETKTGVTVIQMNEDIDTGDMLLVKTTEIGMNETSDMLFARLSHIGADALSETLSLMESGELKPVPQPRGDFGYAAMIDKSMCEIDWNKSAFEIHNQIRALQSSPAAVTVINGRPVKIHKSVLSSETGCGAGKVISAKKVLTVCCGDGKCIDILEVQPVGKKRMDIKSFLAGNIINKDLILGG